MSIPSVNIQPGELYLARTPTLMKTILGSCVGVTFWSPRTGAGALCHGVLPCCPPRVTTAEQHRYVDAAIRYLAQRFDSLGLRRDELEIKVFGGADVLPVAVARIDRPTIGTLNSRRALEVLSAEGFQIAASDLGGDRGRTIHFDSRTGDVIAHRLVRLGGSENEHQFPVIVTRKPNYDPGKDPRPHRR